MGLFEGKVILVVGGGGGLGRACCLKFAEEGGKVAAADLNPERGEETVRLIREQGGEAIFIKADVTKSPEVQAMVRETVDAFGGLDCAVHAHVIDVPPAPLADISEEAWKQHIDISVNGMFLCMKYEIPEMLKRGGGSIVSVGSGNETSAHPGVSVYMAAKYAMIGMSRTAALDYAKQGIRFNCVGPGVMWTPLFESAAARNAGHVERLANFSPMGRIGRPEEVAEAVVWLSSDKASFVDGQVLVADGGALLAGHLR